MANDTPAQGDLLGGPLPANTARIIRLAVDIAETPPDRADFLHSVLCQVGLPRRETKAFTFERTNGKASILIEAGKLWNGKAWIQQPIPYGTRPRLALVHVSSEAVRSKSPVVEVGRSVREFLMRLEVDTGGREYTTFKKQMKALSACRMSLGFGTETVDAKPIERFSAWTDSSGDRDPLTPCVVELTPKFFASLTEYAVPLDARALAALRHSALALDVYTWLAHRLHRVQRVSGERISWKNLREQFGQEYADPKNFKRKMLSTLMAVRAVYPDAKLDQVKGGFILLPSKPPIPKTVLQVRAIGTPYGPDS